LLWQAQGAFEDALLEIEAALGNGDHQEAFGRLERLAARTQLGRRLTRPWRLAIAGAPNVGKSSLMNALAGYQRSIVAPTAGTTRDVVSTLLAFEGWPVTVADTAGIRIAHDALEHAGVERARRELVQADLCLWVFDGATEPTWPEMVTGKMLFVINKLDLPPAWDFSTAIGAVGVSARTGQGIHELTVAVAHALVPEAPNPGEAIPFCDSLCDAIDQAWERFQAGRFDEARQIVHQLLAGDYRRETMQSA
jgi:tRNA modification GTPase